MYRIAIIEDTDADYERITTHIARFEAEQNQSIHVDRYTSAIPFLTDYRPVYDLVFMDIELPKINGMKAAHKLRMLDADIALIFITNISSFAVHGYEVDALDYMVKPVTYPSFLLRMKKALRYIEKNRAYTLTVPCKDGVHRISTTQLRYIEVVKHTLIFHTEQGEIETRGTLKTYEQELLAQHFSRCNNCYLVNLRHVTSVQNNDLVLGDTILPISRPKKKKFMEAFTDYLGV